MVTFDVLTFVTNNLGGVGVKEAHGIEGSNVAQVEDKLTKAGFSLNAALTSLVPGAEKVRIWIRIHPNGWFDVCTIYLNKKDDSNILLFPA